MRADARRNQTLILDAARTQIREHGSEVAMDRIAQAAGVAVGTLYRHYPTKKDLVQAVLREFVESLISSAEEAQRSLAAPGDAIASLRRLLSGFVRDAADDKAIKAVASSLGAEYFEPDLDARGRVALEALLAAARDDGDLRDDITVDDVYLIMSTAPSSAAPAARERWVDIVIAGIRG